MLAVCACLANPVSVSAQTPEDPAAAQLTQAFIDSLKICERRGSQLEIEHCQGIRFGILQAYLTYAGRCHEERQDKDCAEASKLRRSITKALGDTSKQ